MTFNKVLTTLYTNGVRGGFHYSFDGVPQSGIRTVLSMGARSMTILRRGTQDSVQWFSRTSFPSLHRVSSATYRRSLRGGTFTFTLERIYR